MVFELKPLSLYQGTVMFCSYWRRWMFYPPFIFWKNPSKISQRDQFVFLMWVHISLKWKRELLSRVWLFATSWTVALQDPPSMGFSRISMAWELQNTHGIFPRILEWVAISFCMGSSWSRDQTQVSHIAGRLFTGWAISVANALDSPCLKQNHFSLIHYSLSSLTVLF